MCSLAQSTELWLYIFILVAAGGPRYVLKCHAQSSMGLYIPHKDYTFFRVHPSCQVVQVQYSGTCEPLASIRKQQHRVERRTTTRNNGRRWRVEEYRGEEEPTAEKDH